MESELLNKLNSEGWERRFTASDERLKEAFENYRKLGFEVKAIPAKELGCDGCTVCFDDGNDTSMMIFTRKTGAGHDDELFIDDQPGSAFK